MLFETVYDRNNRLRIRLGKWILTEKKARGLACLIRKIEGVNDVQIHFRNGSVLVLYDRVPNKSSNDVRQCVIDILKSTSIDNIPEKESDAKCDSVDLRNQFYIRLAKTVTCRIASNLFLPLKIRNIATCIRAICYAKNGISVCLKSGLTVEVLDAVAITGAIIGNQLTTASNVMFLLRVSDILAGYTSDMARQALRENLNLFSETAWVVNDQGMEEEKPLSEIEVGDVIHVSDGASIPLDGIIEKGSAEINESSMTGESALVAKSEGTAVFAGTFIEAGSIYIKTTARAGQSRIDEIVDLVENSTSAKALAQSNAEKLANSVVPASLLLFLANLAITRTLSRALSVLMVDYSCAIKLSMPIAVMSAMKEAAANNIVAKGGRYLETLSSADAIVFDKTGTLTFGSPKLSKIIAVNGKSADECLKIAACLEEHFPHSMAKAIVNAAKTRNVDHKHELHAEVKYIVAHGIVSEVDNKRVCIGSSHFIFEDEHVKIPSSKIRADIEDNSKTSSLVFMAIDGELYAVFCIEDPLRSESIKVVSALRDAGFKKIVMLTGDSENCARNVADKLTLDDYVSQVLPADKSTYVEKLKSEGHTVVMVGDGINDSPALAVADVSVAMADASDVARGVADITLTDSNLETLLSAYILSKRLMKRIDNSYKFIIRFNSALIALGFVGVLPAQTTALLHNASTLVLCANNTRKLMN